MRADGRARSCGRAPGAKDPGRRARACAAVKELHTSFGALKRNLKQSECFPIMVGLPVAAARACLDQDMHSV